MVRVAYVVEIVEFERGWGSRRDGYILFPSESLAKEYVHKQTANRVGPAPNWYLSYEMVGYKEATQETINIFDAGASQVHVDKLSNYVK